MRCGSIKTGLRHLFGATQEDELGESIFAAGSSSHSPPPLLPQVAAQLLSYHNVYYMMR